MNVRFKKYKNDKRFKWIILNMKSNNAKIKRKNAFLARIVVAIM